MMLRLYAALLVLVTVALAYLTSAAGAPASAPSSQPVIAVLATAAPSVPASQPAVSMSATVLDWLRLNWGYLMLVVVIPSVLAGLKKYRTKGGIVGFIEGVLEFLSALQPSNSSGTLKLPFTRANQPPAPPAPPSPPPQP